jgi:hypothetical protein
VLDLHSTTQVVSKVGCDDFRQKLYDVNRPLSPPPPTPMARVLLLSILAEANIV